MNIGVSSSSQSDVGNVKWENWSSQTVSLGHLHQLKCLLALS